MSDDEMFEQVPHVSDGFGGQRYEASGAGEPSSQTIGQAEAGRVSSMYGIQFGADLNEAARNGSPKVRRRVNAVRWALTIWAVGLVVAVLVTTLT